MFKSWVNGEVCALVHSIRDVRMSTLFEVVCFANDFVDSGSVHQKEGNWGVMTESWT